MSTILLITRFLHLLGAIVGLGGLIMAAVTLPQFDSELDRNRLAGTLGKWIGIGLTVAVLCGGINMSVDLREHSDPRYHLLLVIKATLGIVVFLLSILAFHPAPVFASIRRSRQSLIVLLVALGAVTVALGSKLHTYYQPIDPALVAASAAAHVSSAR